MKLKNIILSPDILISLVLSITLYMFMPEFLENSFVKEVYNTGISVLAIIFSIYFAALAIIISTGDNNFIEYIQIKGFYKVIIGAFRTTLFIIFIALIYSFIIYSITVFQISNKMEKQSKYSFIIFVFLFLYALLATAWSSKDAIKYYEYRIKFLAAQKKDSKEH